MTAWVGLGSNLGPRRAAIWSALDAMDQLRGTQVTAFSPLYQVAFSLTSGKEMDSHKVVGGFSIR